MKSYYKNPDLDDDDGMNALVDAKMQAKKPPPAPPRQNFGPRPPNGPLQPPPSKPALPAPTNGPPKFTGPATMAPKPPPPPPMGANGKPRGTAPTRGDDTRRGSPSKTGTFLSDLPGAKMGWEFGAPDFVPTAEEVAAQLAPEEPKTEEVAAQLAPEEPKTDDEAALDALAAELDSQAAENQTAAARVAGLGGFGLSGATSAQAADIATNDSNERVLALQDLMTQQKDQAFQDVQRDAAIFDLEEASDRDANGDGLINGKPIGGDLGDGDPDNNPENVDNADEKNADAAAAIANMSDAEFEALTKEDAQRAGWTFDPEPVKEDGSFWHGVLDGAPYYVWTGPNGETRLAKQDDYFEGSSGGLEWGS